jgi:hypothetical protein|tara:strand:+ start:2293 stop:2631 length:339 start_codon:yes stop_codon:yes gene_type:complete
MKRNEILDKANELVNGQRAKDYGDAFDNHTRIAEGWNIIARSAYKTHFEITEQHVVLMMDWVKTARLLTTMDHDDSWVDKCGYSSLGGEFSEEDRSAVQMSEFLEDLKEVVK